MLNEDKQCIGQLDGQGVGHFGGQGVGHICGSSGISRALERPVLKREMDWCWKLTKRRMVPGDLLFEEGDIYCRVASKYVPLDVKQDIQAKRVEEFRCCVGNCVQVFDSLTKYESHYNGYHRNVCHMCHRIFPSTHLLEIHVLESHDTMFTLLAAKQDMYQCLVEECQKMFPSTKVRKNHMIKVHKYPHNYRYDQQNKSNKPSKPSSIKEPPVNQPITAEKENIPVTMDTETSDDPRTNKPSPARVFTYKVPKNISFGQGVSRGFLGNRGRGRGGRGRKKHWHNQGIADMDTEVNIETVDMSELSEALS